MLFMTAILVGYTAKAEDGAFLYHDWLASLARTTSHRLNTFFTTESHASGYQALASIHTLQAYSLNVRVFDLLRFGVRSLTLPPLFLVIFLFLSVLF